MLQHPTPSRPFPFAAIILLIALPFACSIWANLSFAVTGPGSYRYFPPFEPGVNANDNSHLGGEYIHIARSLKSGKGFAHPFDQATGPTAWMPPILPAFMAVLLWAFDGNAESVMGVIVFLQVYVLIGTGLLVLALARRTTSHTGAWLATAVFLGALLCNFRLCFQHTHDCWLVLLAVDLLIAGLCFLRPWHRWRTAFGWGLFGGLCALVNPLVALTWGLLSLVSGFRQRAWPRLAGAVLVAGLTLLPWTVRNYVVFDRLLPVKSNLAYELYQSQCLQPDGLIQNTTFAIHPYASAGRERQEYKALGEMAFLDRKRDQFWQSVRSRPLDFFKRVGDRFLGATLWYAPYDRRAEGKRPGGLWLARLTHPLPFLALLGLVMSAFWHRLCWTQTALILVYCIYLLPYVVVSYYDRYAFPLLGVKALLVTWAADRLLSLRSPRRTDAPVGQASNLPKKGVQARNARPRLFAPPVPMQTVMRRTRSHRPAFTLIEVLLVIAIIAALVALLVPAAQHALASADPRPSRIVACRSAKGTPFRGAYGDHVLPARCGQVQ